MAVIKGEFYSDSLEKITRYTAVFPKKLEGPVTVVYLLHGRSGNNNSWINNTNLSRYMSDKNMVVFMPDAEMSYYSNMEYGPNYFDYLTNEFPEKMNLFHSINEKEIVLIGNSMGAYGCLNWALAFPSKFSKVVLLSPLLNLNTLVKAIPTALTDITAAFGNDFQNHESANLLKVLECNSYLTKFPAIIHSCGSNDFFYEDTLELKKIIENKGIPYCYQFSEGGHDWDEWDRSIKDILEKI